MKENPQNSSKTKILNSGIVSNPSGITEKTPKLAPQGAFFGYDEKTVPNLIPAPLYRKRFLKVRPSYKKPTIVRSDKYGWFVKYFYEIPDRPGKFKEFRVKDGVNYNHNLISREKDIQQLRNDVEYALEKHNFNPFGARNNVIAQIEAGKEIKKRRTQLMQCDQALSWFILTKKSKGRSTSTLEGYELQIRRFVNWCKAKGLLRIDDIKIDDIELFLAEHLESEDWSPRTYNNNINSLTTFFNYLVAKRKLPVNPIGLGMLERISNKAEKNRYYDQETLDIIFPEVKKKPALRRYILFTYYSCARGTELRQLQIKHINPAIKKITIMAESGKTGEKVGRRSIPICQELMDIINDEKILQNPLEWYVFGKDGKPGPEQLNKDYFSDQYYQIKNRLNIDFKYTIYSFKHTRVCDLLIAGFEPIVVMNLTGHTDWGSFQKYIRELGAVMDKKLIGNTLKLNI